MRSTDPSGRQGRTQRSPRRSAPRVRGEEPLGEQERQDLLGLLEDAQRLACASATDALAGPVDPALATAALRELWHTVVGALRGDCASAVAITSSSDLLGLLERIKKSDDAMRGLEGRRRSQRLESVRDALGRLQSVESVAGLVAITPQLVCQLGFQRSLVSSVDNSLWVTQSGHVQGDPEWAAEIVQVGRDNVQRLGPWLREIDVVRRRRSLLVRDVASDTRVHRAVVDASRARSYVAAPIVAGSEVIGMLHADRLFDVDDVDEFDRSVLALFSDGLTYALDRVVLLERLDALRSGLAHPARQECVRSAAALTRRELEVVELMAAGLTNACIADRLVVSQATVKSHVKHILRKLNASNRAEAVSQWLGGRAHAGAPAPVALRAAPSIGRGDGIAS